MWWHNAPLLRTISTTLFSLSLLLILYGVGHYVVHQPSLFPLQTVRLVHKPVQVDAEHVQQVVRSRIQGNFLTVDIDQLRLELEKLPWVRKVKIRREFPDRLAVEFEEHQVLAYWGEAALVNVQGEVFSAQTDLELPSFQGPDELSQEVTAQYANFGKLLAGLNFKIEQISLSPRRAWQLKLDNGMVLELGREDVQQRLTRFVSVYPYTAEKIRQAGDGEIHVDLRYRNGFSVKVEKNNSEG